MHPAPTAVALAAFFPPCAAAHAPRAPRAGAMPVGAASVVIAAALLGAIGCQPSPDAAQQAASRDPAVNATATANPTATAAATLPFAPVAADLGSPSAPLSASTSLSAATADSMGDTADDSSSDSADHSAGSEGDEQALPPPSPAELAAVASLPASTKGTPEALVAEVDREVRAMRTSAYAHHTSIDESAGRFEYDCSGFVGYALEGADPAAWTELRNATKPRPLAKDFEGFFASIPPGATRGHWMHVARVTDLKPGDIISWLQPADSTSKNTGHVLIVHGAVTPERAAPGTFYVPIVDSTATKHGAKDSRAANDATGLGTGTILLATDASGAPMAFRWSSGKKSRVRETAIALGRVVP